MHGVPLGEVLLLALLYSLKSSRFLQSVPFNWDSCAAISEFCARLVGTTQWYLPKLERTIQLVHWLQ